MQLMPGMRKPLVYGFTESWPIVNVNCYAKAETRNEDDVTDAQQKAQNMRDQILGLVQGNWSGFAPSWQARPWSGERELIETSIDPPFYTVILPIQFWMND
jgi:hypothetical protein